MPLVATYSVTHLQPHVAITETQKRTVGDSAHPGAVARAAVHPSTSKARPHFAGFHILYPSQTSQLEKWSFECGALIHAARRTKQQQLASSSRHRCHLHCLWLAGRLLQEFCVCPQLPRQFTRQTYLQHHTPTDLVHLLSDGVCATSARKLGGRREVVSRRAPPCPRPWRSVVSN